MSDMRFIMIGIGLIFVGFLVLGGLGSIYHAATIESDEFGVCYEYFDDKAPVQIECSEKILEQVLFFAVIIIVIGAGVVALVYGLRGDWDNKIKPEDKVGPSK